MREDWSYHRLEEVVDFRGGGTPSKRNKTFWGGEIPWVSPKDMKVREITSSADTITTGALDKSAARLIPPGAVLIVVRSGILARTIPIAVAGRDLTVNQDLKALCPSAAIQTEYLHYFLESAEPELLQRVTRGATVHRLATDSLKGLRVPLPSEREQKRIVAILDEAFAAIDAAVAHAEKNLANARELFESFLNATFARKQEGWFETTIGEQVTLQRGFDITKKQQKPGTVPVVSSGGIKSYHNVAQVDGPGVVLGRKGSIGSVYFVGDAFWPHDTTLWVKEFKGNLPKLVYYFFTSVDLTGLDTGTANPALNRNLVHPKRIIWPSVDRQPALVHSLDAMVDATDALTGSFRTKLATLELLKQSILQKAFSGQLTAKEAEKAMAAA